ncbi:butyrate kinase [Marininema mesophilum]|uniref:butyrate kinase n=2 Tax=Marininema mesophilum TaxID=1048340 RepID=A0A1H2UF15_9BACL|nr:butyrate kinase [Marininema mesophilum]
MYEPMRILAINPGSTSTKIGVYDGERKILEETLRHDAEELEQYTDLFDQYPFRKQVILDTLDRAGINLTRLCAVVGRCGLLQLNSGGTYLVNDAMLKDLTYGKDGEHASNLGGVLAFEIADKLNIPSFIVAPDMVDELELIPLSDVPQIEERRIIHVQQKAAARRFAAQKGKHYHELNLVVIHMSVEITVGAHRRGQVIDLNKGRKVEGEEAQLVCSTMAYQVAKEIGAYATALNGNVDGIVLTEELAYEEDFVREITDRVSWIAEVCVLSGENELQVLVEEVLRVMRSEEPAKRYPDGILVEGVEKIHGRKL